MANAIRDAEKDRPVLLNNWEATHCDFDEDRLKQLFDGARQVAAGAGEMLSKLGIQDVETIQIAVSRLSANHSFKQQPAPWIITGRGE